MAKKPEQKLILLKANSTHQDLTEILKKFPWWGEGWRIEQVSLAPYGKDHQDVFVAVVLEKEAGLRKVRATRATIGHA